MKSISKHCSSRSTKRAASLIEILISCAIMSLVLTCIYALFQAGVRYLRSTNTAIELQQQSLLGMIWLTHDLGESNTRTIKVFSDGPGILLGSPRDDAGNTWVDVSGSVRWAKFICYYIDTVDNRRCLLRKEQYMDDPDLHTDPPPLLPPIPQSWQDYAYYQVLEIPPRIVARDVESLTFSGNNPMQIVLKVARVDFGRSFDITLQVKVSMKN